MVDIFIMGSNLVLEIEGVDKLWAFKSRIEVPVSCLRGVRIDARFASRPQGLRSPGTHLPGVISAGTFHHAGKRIFWDVHNPMNAIVVDLADHHYAQLVVEVEDPAETVELIKKVIPKQA